MKKFISLASWFLLMGMGDGFTQQVSYTSEDRDRIIKLESELTSLRNETKSELTSLRNETKSELTSLRNEMMTRFDSQQRQMDVFYWGFGITISLILFLFGYIIFDRRTVTEPMRDKIQSLLQSLREYANEQPKLQEILRTHGIL